MFLKCTTLTLKQEKTDNGFERSKTEGYAYIHAEQIATVEQTVWHDENVTVIGLKGDRCIAITASVEAVMTALETYNGYINNTDLTTKNTTCQLE